MLRLLYISITALLLMPVSYAETVSVAVASNFSTAMQALAKDFEHQSGHNVVLTFGSSGKFYAQISHGAPYDVFLSADQQKPQRLAEEGLGIEASRFTYARGKLALWRKPSSVVVDPLTLLRSGNFNKLAFANPKLAPYGVAAQQVLTALELDQFTRHQWVWGENVAQTFQFIHTGNADLGFVALSQLLTRSDIEPTHYWAVPTTLYSPIKQDAILLTRASHNPAAIALTSFLREASTQNTIATFGYEIP